MSDFCSKVKKAVDDFNMLKNGDNVLVALSGGADSVALFHALYELGGALGISLFAAHVNHNLRGDEASRDENFVRAMCGKYGVELFVESVDVRALAKRRKLSEELCGREVRYEFFEKISRELNAKTATAHTASDNAETVIFNLARGAGLRGLSGIRPKRGSIIRPLIYVTRDEVEDYCRENRLDFVTDSTNLCDDYTRNKIRHSVIPALKEINPGLEKTISRESFLLREYNSFLELKTDEAVELAKTKDGFDSKIIAGFPDALRLAVIKKLCGESGADVDFKLAVLVDEALRNGGAVNIGSGVRAICKQGLFRLVRLDDVDYFSETEIKPHMSFLYNKKQYSVKELKIDRKAVFRTRRAGDTFTLPRRNVTKTIKKLFNELKIPEEQRDSVMLVADGSDILWIEGVGASKDAEGKIDITVNRIV